MIHIRIEAAGYVLKDSGVGYAVGKVFPKKLKTGGTETVRSGTYYFSLSSALRVFARKVFVYGKTDRERFFAQLLLRFSIIGGKTSPAEGLRKACGRFADMEASQRESLPGGQASLGQRSRRSRTKEEGRCSRLSSSSWTVVGLQDGRQGSAMRLEFSQIRNGGGQPWPRLTALTSRLRGSLSLSLPAPILPHALQEAAPMTTDHHRTLVSVTSGFLR